MITKTDKVRRLVSEGKYKQALGIAKDFRLGISKDDSEAMKRGYECIVHPRFYQTLGMDTEEIAQQGIQAVIRLYG